MERILRFISILNLLSVSDRTVLLKKNVILSTASQLMNVFFQFMLVPVAMNYLTPIGYGVWITLYGVINYFSVADLGIGNGLKQQLTMSVSNGDYHLAKTLVSTAYVVIGLIMAMLIFVVLSVSQFLSWGDLLNAPKFLTKEVDIVFLIAIAFFGLRSFLGIFQIVLSGFQLSALNNVTNAFSALIVLLLFSVVPQSEWALIIAALIVLIPQCVVLLIQSLFGYNTSLLKGVSPSFRAINFSMVRSISSTGMRFFIIQIVYIVIFLSDNLIISHVLGPESVTEYNVAYRLFTVPLVFFNLIATPLWGAFADAYAKADSTWIKNSVKKLMRIWILFILFVFILLVFADMIYIFWLGVHIKIPFLISISMALFVVVHSGGMVFTTFVNAVGKIKLQTILSVIVGIVNIPLSIFFAHLWGSAGVMLATTVCLAPPAVITYFQYKKLIFQHAEGIWNG